MSRTREKEEKKKEKAYSDVEIYTKNSATKVEKFAPGNRETVGVEDHCFL